MKHSQLAKCSSAAYIGTKSFRKIGFDHVIGFTIDNHKEPMGYLAIDNNKKEAVLAFRGTEHWKDVASDIRFMRVRSINNRHIHGGFLARWKRVRASINIACGALPKEYKLYVTGHSLGGAMAAIYLLQGRRKATEVVSFGAPRVGGLNVAKSLTGKGLIRYVNKYDLVTYVPRMGYIHGGRMILLTSKLDHVTWAQKIWSWIRKPKTVFKPHTIKSYIKRVSKLGA